MQLFYDAGFTQTPKLILAFGPAVCPSKSGLGRNAKRLHFLFGISRPFFAMFLGPALYLYFLCIHRADSHLERRDFVHFVVVGLFFPGLA